jgi:chromosome condensin MukBEF ATPase and DNA-binding subunit MukB
MVRKMSENDIHRDIGSISAQIEVLNREMRDIKSDVKQLREDFAAVKGGWRTLIGIAAILGAGVSWLANYVIGKH